MARGNVAGHIADTIVGTGVELKGELNSDGDIVIDGQVRGNVTSKGEVTIGMHGSVIGDVVAKSVSLSGALKGDIEAKDAVQIGHAGRHQGQINCRSIAIQAGAYFVGKISMPEPSDDVTIDIPEEADTGQEPIPEVDEFEPKAE